MVILLIWAYMYVFYIVFFSVLGLVATGYLVNHLVKRRAYRVKPTPESKLPKGIRPAYS